LFATLDAVVTEQFVIDVSLFKDEEFMCLCAVCVSELEAVHFC